MEDAPEESDDENGKRRIPLEQYADVELGALQIAPDGGIAGPIGVAPSVEAATPEHFICLRGPCRHYWQIESFMASGNPKDTWGDDGLKDEDGNPIRQPRQISRSCTAQPGIEMEITDDCIYECSRWDPMTRRDLKKQAARRSKYLKLHPEHDRKSK